MSHEVLNRPLGGPGQSCQSKLSIFVYFITAFLYNRDIRKYVLVQCCVSETRVHAHIYRRACRLHLL